MMDALSKVSDGTRMLAEATTAFDALRIADAAEAYRYAIKLPGGSEEAQRKASELKLRAERRAGVLLRDMPKAPSGREAVALKSEGRTSNPTYAEQGFEIKGDFKFQSRGFLWIEYAEKSNAANPSYVPSGICRKDNSWFFLIGDWTRCYIFGKRQLRFICRYKAYERIQSLTSQAYAIPISEAEKWCEGRLKFGEKDDPSPFLATAKKEHF